MKDDIYEEKIKNLLQALAVKSLTRSLVDMLRKASKSTPLKRSKHRFGHPTPNPRPFRPPNIDLGKGKCIGGRDFADRQRGSALGLGRCRGSATWICWWWIGSKRESGELFRFLPKKESYSGRKSECFYFKNFGYFKNFFIFGWTCGGALQTPHYYIWCGQLWLNRFGFFKVLRIQRRKVW